MTVNEYNKLVDKHGDGVYRFVLKHTKNGSLAQDIVQEAFTRMWERYESINFISAKSYLFSAAYHLIIDNYNKNNKIQQYANSLNIENKYINNHYSDLQEILNKALDNIPQIQKSVILLRDYEGYSYKEIGEITNLSESQVKVYIFRARLSLQKSLISIDAVI